MDDPVLLLESHSIVTNVQDNTHPLVTQDHLPLNARSISVSLSAQIKEHIRGKPQQLLKNSHLQFSITSMEILMLEMELIRPINFSLKQQSHNIIKPLM